MSPVRFGAIAKRRAKTKTEEDISGRDSVTNAYASREDSDWCSSDFLGAQQNDQVRCDDTSIANTTTVRGCGLLISLTTVGHLLGRRAVSSHTLCSTRCVRV